MSSLCFQNKGSDIGSPLSIPLFRSVCLTLSGNQVLVVRSLRKGCNSPLLVRFDRATRHAV